MSDPPTDLMGAGEAAKRLGISTAMLRRHAATYEKVYGDLPRGKHGHRGRGFTPEAIERIRDAITTYGKGDAVNVEDAMRFQATGERYPARRAVPEKVQPGGNLEARMMERLDAYAQTQAVLLEEIRSLREEVQQLRALPPSEDAQKRPLWVRVADFILGRPEAL